MEATPPLMEDMVPHKLGRPALSACQDRILPGVPGMKQMGKRRLLYNATKGQIIYPSISIPPPTPSPSPSPTHSPLSPSFSSINSRTPSPSPPRTTHTITNTHEHAPRARDDANALRDDAHALRETARGNAHERAHDYREVEARKIAQVRALQFLRDLDVQMQNERKTEANATNAKNATSATNAINATNMTNATNATNATFSTIATDDSYDWEDNLSDNSCETISYSNVDDNSVDDDVDDDEDDMDMEDGVQFDTSTPPSSYIPPLFPIKDECTLPSGAGPNPPGGEEGMRSSFTITAYDAVM